MEILKLTCKVITPMFMTGADGKTPELRPSEFKGMMRFWWRAIKAESNIEDLKKKEAKIFGGTGEKEGKSKVILKVIPNQINKQRYSPLPHSRTKKFTFECIYENSIFEVILKGEEKFLKIFKDCFLLSTILGGFGKRSRRGFGSVEIIEPNELNLGVLTKEKMIEKILEILNEISNQYEIRNSKIVNRIGGGNYPYIVEIEIGQNYSNNWEDLLRRIGNASHTHKDPSLGNASPRMASPIYVSVIKLEKGYYPIITTLNSSFPKKYPFYNLEKQNYFKREVLS